MQTMVREGAVFCTLHSAFLPQGERAGQGSRQVSCMQARRLGQSLSTTHSGRLITASGTEKGEGHREFNERKNGKKLNFF
jgi:hypothetical protein